MQGDDVVWSIDEDSKNQETLQLSLVFIFVSVCEGCSAMACVEVGGHHRNSLPSIPPANAHLNMHASRTCFRDR